MLYFQVRPDPVFNAILKAAIETELGRLAQSLPEPGHSGSSGSYWSLHYPYTSRCFPAGTAVPILERLLVAAREMAVYLITDHHWVLLYECLENFCASHNERAEQHAGGFQFVGDYPLCRIDFQGIIKIYFWDTDFLISKELFEMLGVADRKRVRLSDSAACGLADGWELHPLELLMRRVEQPQWHKAALLQWFRPGSGCYPDSALQAEGDFAEPKGGL